MHVFSIHRRLSHPLVLIQYAMILFCATSVGAQTGGSISGRITDPQGLVINKASIEAINVDTNATYFAATNNIGLYQIVEIPVGVYRIVVGKQGFAKVVKPNVDIHVQDLLTLNVSLPVGSITESMTVEGGAPMINTIDGSVSTIVDRNFIENMPLNGRSFQDLILLTPGIVTTSPQGGVNRGAVGANGEFNVNGQRSESNYYTVDGVSANVGIQPGVTYGPAMGGGVPASTALGTTHGLVSVDALQEFRVATSTYSAEYGRSPGAQFSFVTRSGTSHWHGTAFDYFRNDVMDANNWFNDFYQQAKPALHQNDFGGTLGGPLTISGLRDGKDKTFFLFAYEGLRLLQPQPSSVSYVPTSDLRNTAPSQLQPVLKAFPLPFCPSSAVNCATDLGGGAGQFVSSWSNPSSIDAYSVRLDHSLSSAASLFFRFSNTTSDAVQRLGGLGGSPSELSGNSYLERTYTFGISHSLPKKITNMVRLNYTTNSSVTTSTLDGFGGATPTNLLQLQSINPQISPDALVSVSMTLGGFSTNIGQSRAIGDQKQWNIVDTVAVLSGGHSLKSGFDYRRLAPEVVPQNPSVNYLYFNSASVSANSADLALAASAGAAYPLYTNFSAFVQDDWRIASRVALSMGMRWEVNPAPGAAKGNLPYTLQSGLNVNDSSTWKLAPYGTSLWKTTWFDIAPRLGIAYAVRNKTNYQTVLRGGVGIFYDTGQQLGSQSYQGPGFVVSQGYGRLYGSPASFPLPINQASPALERPPSPPYLTAYGFYPHLQLPYTIQSSVSIEQGLGKAQSVSLSYIGASARRLLQYTFISSPVLADVLGVQFVENGQGSRYDGFQAQFQRRMSKGFQAVISYTWSHCSDFGSIDASLPYERGPCDFDVRNNLSSALAYNLPVNLQSLPGRIFLNRWGLDGRMNARTAFPVALRGLQTYDPVTGRAYYAGLDLVPNTPLYLSGSNYPGGRTINPAAFALPAGCSAFFCAPGTPPGNAPRNLARGFGAWQVDLAVRREFPIHEGLKLQFRAEAFNAFNRPNFGGIDSLRYCSGTPGCTWGQATGTLSQSLGILSPLYQMGGPRSLQLALRFLF
jgi:carboxypeptidase family protein